MSDLTFSKRGIVTVRSRWAMIEEKEEKFHSQAVQYNVHEQRTGETNCTTASSDGGLISD